jgi:hypothetical protein
VNLRKGPVVHNPNPTVNLLSPWAFEAMATRKLYQWFAAGAVALLLLTTLVWSVQHLRTQSAQQSLAQEQARTRELTTQSKQLQPVQSYVSTVDDQKKLAGTAMQHEVLLSRVVSGLRQATPKGARMESISMTVSPSADDDAAGTGATPAPSATTGSGSGASCPGPDPFHTRELVGCVTVSGSARSRASVGALVENLGRDRLFVEPFISTTTTGDGKGFEFTGSVGLSTRAYSHRYADMDALLGVTK